MGLITVVLHAGDVYIHLHSVLKKEFSFFNLTAVRYNIVLL